MCLCILDLQRARKHEGRLICIFFEKLRFRCFFFHVVPQKKICDSRRRVLFFLQSWQGKKWRKKEVEKCPVCMRIIRIYHTYLHTYPHNTYVHKHIRICIHTSTHTHTHTHKNTVTPSHSDTTHTPLDADSVLLLIRHSSRLLLRRSSSSSSSSYPPTVQGGGGRPAAAACVEAYATRGVCVCVCMCCGQLCASSEVSRLHVGLIFNIFSS